MPAKPDSDSMPLQLHLQELRGRLLRCLLYLAAGTVVGWLAFGEVFRLISEPIRELLESGSSRFLLTGIAEGFIFKLQVSVITAVAISLPLLGAELWGFIAPGLTAQERRGVYLVAPLSIILFVMGIAVSYAAIPVGVRWLVSQNPPGVVFMPSVTQAVLFVMKMVLAFGLMFELPVVLIFLARIGVVDSAMLTKYWRQSVVGIAVLAAVITPSGDAITMLIVCVPVVVLYLASIGLVRLVQKKRPEAASDGSS